MAEMFLLLQKKSMILSCMWIFSFSWRPTTQLEAYSLREILTFML